MHRLPFFSNNGAIVLEKIDRDRYRVSVGENMPAVVVDLDTSVNGAPLVEFSPSWLHTSEDGENARMFAIAAVYDCLGME